MKAQILHGSFTSHAADRGETRGTARRRRRLIAGLSAGFLTGAALITSAAPAQAATTVRVIGDNLEVQMTSGVLHNTAISLVSIPGRGDFYQIRDTRDTLTAGSRCFNIDTRTVRCARGPIASLRANGGLKDDVIAVNAAFRGFVTINGGQGHDQITGSPGADNIFGGAGNDRLYGQGGNDYVRGGDGNDLLLSGPGQDSIYGDNGADTWLAEATSDFRADGFSGGAGVDTASYQLRNQPVVVRLNNAGDDGATGERDNVLADVENVWGGNANDFLVGSGVANRMHGGAGNDTVYGLNGNDWLEGGTGIDSIIGGNGGDTMGGGEGNDRLFGIDGIRGNDRLDGWAGTDTCSRDASDLVTRCER